MKIFVAIPVYDGKLPVQVVSCLLTEQSLASQVGDDLRTMFLPGCSHPAQGRNQLAQLFLDSDADKLFFLDSDIVFDPGSITKLCHYPVDLVGGCYRLKQEEELYPMGWLNKPNLQADEYGLLEVSSLPGGFMSISRNVFETMKMAYPNRGFDHMGHRMNAFFEMKFANGNLQGEDGGFCLDWLNAGGKVFLDPEIGLTHLNFMPTPYAGHIGNWLKGRNKETVSGAQESLSS